MQTSYHQEELDFNKVLAIDLGVKRVAATFDGKETVTYNGKPLMSLMQLQNKHKARTQEKLSWVKKGSKRDKKIQRGKRKLAKKFNDKKKDILHKLSKVVCEHAIEKGIGTIVFGDNASTHDKTNLGKNNQMVQQNPEQQFKKFLTQKFERIGGRTAVHPEHYTSQDCPPCGHRQKPKGRTYKCIKCGFSFDRDGVGAVNIYCDFKKVSFKKLDVGGALTVPIGVKYRSCLSIGNLRFP